MSSSRRGRPSGRGSSKGRLSQPETDAPADAEEPFTEDSQALHSPGRDEATSSTHKPKNVPPGTLANPLHSAPGSATQRKSKVPIPRLQTTGSQAPSKSSPSAANRVAHACEPCRTRKTKCSGERPTCKHCLEVNTECYYADGKRDRFKRDYDEMKQKISLYEKLLMDNGILNLNLELTSTDPVGPAPSNEGDFQSSSRIAEHAGGEGSFQEFGFTGKWSDLNWLGRLTQITQGSQDHSKRDAFSFADQESNPTRSSKGNEQRTNRRNSGSSSTTGSSSAPSTNNNVDPEIVDEWEKPTNEELRRGLDIFFDVVHPYFPIISRPHFLRKFDSTIGIGQDPMGFETIFVQLNIIMAISAHYSELRNVRLSTNSSAALFFARAHKILSRRNMLTLSPTSKNVKTVGLASFYLMSISQLDRAWLLSGKAMRIAVALGYHVQDTTLPEHKQERRYRIWWSIYMLERLLSVMTGRPSAFALGDFSVPLPHLVSAESLSPENKSTPRVYMNDIVHSMVDTSPPDDGSLRSSDTPARQPTTEIKLQGLESLTKTEPSDELFLRFQIYLDLISHSILASLYRPASQDGAGAARTSTMLHFDRTLSAWLTALPKTFDFTLTGLDSRWLRHRLCLGFAFYSTRIILYLPNLSVPHNEFDKTSRENTGLSYAARCVRSASDMLDLVPEGRKCSDLYAVVPWFAFTHYILQACLVLLVELSMPAFHAPQLLNSILIDTKKAVRLLHALGESNELAYKVWERAYRVICRIAPTVNVSVDDLPSEPPVPRSLNNPMRYDQRASATARQSTEPWIEMPGMLEGHPLMSELFEQHMGAEDMEIEIPEDLDLNDPRTWASRIPNISLPDPDIESS